MSVTKRCLVTGGAGFIGSHIVDSLAAAGWQVKALNRSVGQRAGGEGVPSVVRILGDFRDRETVRRALEGVDTVLHYASTTTPATAHGRALFDLSQNLAGTVQLLDEAVTAGVRRFVFPSSGGTVYGPIAQVPTSERTPCEPICSHGIVKRAIESYVQLYGREQELNYTILRYSNPYGPRQRLEGSQGVVAVFAHRILSGRQIEVWGDGQAVRDFVYIDDLVEATLMATTSPLGVNRVFNIGSGEGVSVAGLIASLEECIGRRADVQFIPARKFDVPTSILDISLIRQVLDWSPKVSLRDGLIKTMSWLTGLV